MSATKSARCDVVDPDTHTLNFSDHPVQIHHPERNCRDKSKITRLIEISHGARMRDISLEHIIIRDAKTRAASIFARSTPLSRKKTEVRPIARAIDWQQAIRHLVGFYFFFLLRIPGINYLALFSPDENRARLSLHRDIFIAQEYRRRSSSA